VRTSRRAWIVWGVAVAAYVVAVFQRASLGVAGVEAQRRFGATPGELSLFIVLQLGVYASLQVPVGVLLDRFGARRLIVTGALVMGAGQLVMATAQALGPAVAGRVLVGAGDALTFISVLRIVAAWFAPPVVPVMTQLTGLIGQLGQVAAAYPLVALLQDAGWTPSYLIAGFAGIGLAAASVVAVRDLPPGVPRPPGHASLADAAVQLRHAWREPGTRLGLWTHFSTQFSGTVFALLWGFPFLIEGEGRSPGEAGLLLTLLVLVAMGVGPVLGSIAGRWPFRRSVPTLGIVGATAVAWAVVLLWPGRAPLALLVALVVVLATNGPGSLMGFDYARTENHPKRIGSATGIVNVGGFVASLCTIALIGIVLGLTGSYEAAMAVQYPVWAVGLAGILLSRRRLRAARGVTLDPFPRAVVRVTRERRRQRS
jgi:MFS family permease